ncbi:glutathione S-transferase family protein [Cognatishimia activa]|uniref:Glutathione S-transferase GST-4.5 n=1 Tax=Cognatishimia activa TaxID=1715691 RepID=A0A0P1IQ65_9RHOB|nr:glutathione S-transferase family protein [Cognatishimia activa]CUJ10222.1 Glutathione S-transferase GST-4.5 [Cognatishimia activa]CUK25733.1 Glutathione S-transferase GST-4.5 [Cognatishimia activa]
MTMKLYCFGESGNAYKAALSLELSGLPWEAQFVDFFNGEARSEDYKKNVNEMGEVPVLVDGDVKLSQSGVIQQYITDKTGKFGGESDAERYEVLRWVLWDNHKMSSQAGVTRFLLNFLPEDKRPQEAIAFLQGRLSAAYTILDGHLADKDWIVGDEITNADISNCAYLFYPEPFGFIRKDWSNIDRWLANIEATPGWKHPYELMPGHPSDRGL